MMKECSNGHLVKSKRCGICGKDTRPVLAQVRMQPVPWWEIRAEGPKVWEAHRAYRAALRQGTR